MKSVVLPSGRSTSRLGFGAGALRLSEDGREAARSLDAAYDVGIRHFDVAPSYGFGLAEDAVGAFAARHRGAITITTKVGITRPTSPKLMTRLRAVARPIFNSMPQLRRALGGTVFKLTTARAQFDAATVKESLAESLRRLQVETIDIFLLHEAGPDDISDELLKALDEARRMGDIGCFGVGSVRAKAEAVMRSGSGAMGVVQVPFDLDDVLGRRILTGAAPAPFLITHGVLRQFLGDKRWRDTDAVPSKSVASVLGAGLADDKKVVDLLMSVAYVSNPVGMVLTGSNHPAHIARNADLLEDAVQLAAGARLVELLAGDGAAAERVGDLTP